MPNKKSNGKYHISTLSDHDRTYMDLTGDPHVRLEVLPKGRVDGTFEFGAQAGELDGRIEKAGEGKPKLTFTFEGEDEGDPVHGYGVATLVDENTLKGEMHYHRADTERFVWKRV